MTYYHHIPGRLRVRCETVRRNEKRAAEAKRLLAAVPGVESADVNPLTGSIVARYSPGAVTPDVILGVLREQGYLCSVPEMPRSRVGYSSSRTESDLGSSLARKVATSLVEVALERSVVALVGALL
jgi:hypothetical protein